MTLDSAYEKAFEIKRKNLSAKQSKYELDIQNLYDNSPEYRDIMQELSKIGPQLATTAFSGEIEKFEELKQKANKLNEAKNAIIGAVKIAGFAFDCDICRDTGYVDGRICDCVKSLAARIFLENSPNCNNPNLSFDDFDLSLYSDEPHGNTSPAKRMQSILKYVVNYTNTFSKETTENLLFVGNTGLGKTYLSLMIFNQLIKKGFNVIYQPAFNLLSTIENERFNKRSDETYNNVLNADLLIIDDLGSEFVSSFAKSVFYNILNSRLLACKPMIISTNISIKEIEKTYSPRVSSRIFGNFTAKQFLGKDIRQIKKME